MDGDPRKSLRITQLQLRDFRSYGSFQLSDLDGLTILVGPNGIGKTNVLEAIALLTSTKSFRQAQIAQLIRQGAAGGSVRATLTDGNRCIESELLMEPGKRRHRLNGKAKQASEVRGMLPAVSFTPDDLQLAKRSSSVRRQALDDLGMQLTANYYVVRRDYEKVVRYKNRLLKDEAPQALIDSINEMVVTCGSQLFCYRVALVQRLAPLMASSYGVIARNGGSQPEALTLGYFASWDQDEAQDLAQGPAPSRNEVRDRLEQALQEMAGQERARGRSLAGPHGDAVTLQLDGRDAALFASQGQQRSIVLAWKLAEVECVRESLGTSPVLLLDDVMSELDGSRRDTLVRFVTDDMQTFITATDLAGFNEDLLSRARVVELPLDL